MVSYEWCVEMVTAKESTEYEQGEVLDSHFVPRFVDAVALWRTTPDEGTEWRVVLVRDTPRDRSWAYLEEDHTLPEWFTDTRGAKVYRVPQRFHSEVA